MFGDRAIELGHQSVPLTPEADVPLAASAPLYALGEQAPAASITFEPEDVRFSFSNDESAAYFDQTRSRTLTPEYRQATNRVAVVVGESSLAAALSYIPEETIVVVDKSPHMAAFMRKYIESLRTAETPDEWANMMGFGTDHSIGHGEKRMLYRLLAQVREWHASGYPHPLNDPESYRDVHRLARQKAIVPWRADIHSRKDMKRLGKALKASDAHVTMLNLTNVMACEGSLKQAGDYANRLGHLPVTADAPILATTTQTVLKPGHELGYIVEATGPFFGLDNLKTHGGSTLWRKPGSVLMRKYLAPSRSEEEITAPAAMEAMMRQLIDIHEVTRGDGRCRSASIGLIAISGHRRVGIDVIRGDEVEDPEIRSALRDIFRS